MDVLHAAVQRKASIHVLAAPSISTPCVCGGGPGLRDEQALDEAEKCHHSAYCWKFMEACTKNIVRICICIYIYIYIYKKCVYCYVDFVFMVLEEAKEY